MLSGKTERGETFTILYVRDPSGQAFVYLPPLGETDHPQHLSEESGAYYAEHAGKWYPFFRLAQFAMWDDLIAGAVAQSSRQQ